MYRNEFKEESHMKISSKSNTQIAPNKGTPVKNSINNLVEQYSQKARTALEIEEPIWKERHQGIELAPSSIALTYYSYIYKYGFNPMAQEIVLAKYADQSWQMLITVDGWYVFMNRHPHFAGISFKESIDLINQIPAWMECAIYRSDRNIPIIIREYYLEVKTDHESWEKMPRRMLRHRTLSQCARMAFGIALPDASSQMDEGSTKIQPIDGLANQDLQGERKRPQGQAMKGSEGLRNRLNLI